MRCAATVLVLQLVLAPGATADDWPQWRGPEGTGVADGQPLPTRWGDGDNIAWKTPLRGLGVSSPIVSGDRVFVTYQIGRGVLADGSHPTLVRGPDTDPELERPLGEARVAGARGVGGEAGVGGVGGDADAGGVGGGADPGGVSFAVAAFDRADGSLLWEHELAAEGPLHPVHSKHNLASPSPVTDGELVYAWFGTGQLVAVDMAGREVWRRHLGRELGPFEIQWGHSSSPTLYRDSLILLCDHAPSASLLALDKRTGEQLWKVDRGREMSSYSTPLVVPGPGGDVLIVNSSHRLEGYDPANGELLWHVGEPNQFPIPVATWDGEMLYTSRGYRSGPYMAVRLGGRGDVNESHVEWRVETGAPYISSILHYHGLIYMANGNGIVTCVDAATGERVWQERIGGIFSASPVGGDGKVYLSSETGETVVLEAGRAPRVLARNDLGERVIASPALSNGQIFIRTDEHLVRVGT